MVSVDEGNVMLALVRSAPVVPRAVGNPLVRCSPLHRGLVVVALAVVTLSGCGGSDDAASNDGGASGWAAEAVEFFEAHAAARCRQDVYDIARFYAVDATVDHRAVMLGAFPGREFADRSAFLSYFDLCFSPERSFDATVGRTFVGATGAVVIEQWAFGAPQAASTVASVVGIGEDGVIESMRYLPQFEGSIESASERFDRVEHVAVENVDSQRWEIVEVYLADDGGASLDDVIVVVDDRQASCVVRRAWHWTFIGDELVDDASYLDVESARQCLDVAELGDGWWTGLDLPVQADRRQTATLAIGDEIVRLFNSDTAREGLVRWAFDRYASSGLPVFAVDRIVFEPSRSCGGLSGLAHVESDDTVVYMCLADVCETSSCDDFSNAAKLSMLHELAHQWLAQMGLDEETQSALLALTGAPTWKSHTHDWDERGIEWAAETIAWGLLDEPVELLRLGFPPCEVLEEVFHLLTGRPPAVRCPID